MTDSRNKGKRGEYEWRDILNKTFNTKYARTPLSGGMDLKGDVRRTYNCPKTIADDFHWEVKRVEKLNIHQAMRQSIKDARSPSIPCVPFRKNSEPWLLCLKADDFLSILIELEQLRTVNKKSKKPTDFETWANTKNLSRKLTAERKKCKNLIKRRTR